ncbi:hypothetical protein VZT92_017351 [Zoarces viviparus]|uniref:Uncharacterized protein n=1 Tax=Zoarces viviparus TaxID=48416 RepID=A0AAW1ERK1_ZOAVI
MEDSPGSRGERPSGDKSGPDKSYYSWPASGPLGPPWAPSRGPQPETGGKSLKLPGLSPTAETKGRTDIVGRKKAKSQDGSWRQRQMDIRSEEEEEQSQNMIA